jgi:ABC-type antimicrobial peptide transport system permease subunit
MSVFERTREIGVLRAVGWRRRRIVGLILGEALVVALLGGIAGSALGIGLTALARLSPSVETLLRGVFTPAMFVQALVVALLLGAVGGVYPAWRAAQLAPVEAMRAEGGAGVHWGRATGWLARQFSSSALRSLWRRPARTLVTIVGLGIGVGFIVALLAVTEGATASFTALLSAGQADLVAEQANASDATFSSIDERIAERIRVRPDVLAVSRLVFGTSSAPGLPFFIVYGLDPREPYLQHYRVREGRAIVRPREIIIGRFAANSLKKGVGDRLQLGGTGYRIVGIYETGVSYEDAGGVIALREAQRLFHKPRKLSFIGITLHDPAQADAIAKELERAFPQIIVSKAANLTERMQDFASMRAIFDALAALTIVVGGIVMMNVMMMSVFERTQEIGVLRALGWRRRRVLRMVLGEALALGLLSALAGSVIGVGLNLLLTLEPTYGAFLPPRYTPGLFVQAVSVALVLGVLGGLYPAWRAASLHPVEALHYE